MKQQKRISGKMPKWIMLGIICLTVFWYAAATAEDCGKNLTWFLSDDGKLIIRGTGPMYDFDYFGPWQEAVKEAVIEDGVTSIGINAFYDCRNLTSVTIPGSVTSIGINAFSDCTNLTSVTISGSMTSIGERAFQNCSSLTNVTIPDGVTDIGVNTF